VAPRAISRHDAPMVDTIRIGDHTVPRMGFGAMRLPGRDVWGPPEDPARARQVLQGVRELGIQFIDTSWYYGPFVANELIAEVLYPYPRELVIATKLGGKRLPDKSWRAFARPAELREGCEHDLRTLKRDVLDIVHLRYMGASGVPFAESLGAMMDMQREGKIRHIALSNVGKNELVHALSVTTVAAVQNLYSVAGGGGKLAQMTHAEVEDPEGVLDECIARGIPFLPFFPLGVGTVLPLGALARSAQRHGKKPAQIALAWLLARAKVMLPIPGTSSPEHLHENWAARSIELSKQEQDEIAAEARGAAAA
jgi:aryl-alcohol dehydrogenase-like predicted oxidoreductase